MLKLQSPSLLFLLLSFIGCVKANDATTAALGPNRNSASAKTQLVLKPNINTFFKAATTVLQSDKTMARCGIKVNDDVTLEEAPIPGKLDAKVAAKYYYGKLVQKGETYGEVAGFCSSGKNGYIYKEHVDFVRKQEVAAATQADTAATTQDQSQAQANSNTQAVNPGVDSNPDYDSLPSTVNGSYSGLPRKSHPISSEYDDYINPRITAAIESAEREVTETAEAQANHKQFVPFYYVISSSKRNGKSDDSPAYIYSKDGRTRFYGFNRPQVYPLFINGVSTPNFTAMRFKEWDGTIKPRVLLPASAAPSMPSDYCEEIMEDGRPARYEKGDGFTPCSIPVDENGLNWLWFDCDKVWFFTRARSNVEKTIFMTCSSVQSSKVFEMQP